MLFTVMFTVNVAFPQSAADYKMKIEKLDNQLAQYMITGDTVKSLTMYTNDAITMPSYEPMNRGLAAIRKSNQEMMKKGVKYNSFELTPLEVIPEGNLITEIGTYKINASMPNMNSPEDDHGKYLTIWEKQKDGSLKVKIETWNSDVNPMMKMQQTSQKGMEQK